MEGGLSARQSALKSLRRSHRKCFKESEAGFSFMKPVYRWIKIKVQGGISTKGHSFVKLVNNSDTFFFLNLLTCIQIFSC